VIEEAGVLRLARFGEKLLPLSEVPFDQLNQEEKDHLALLLSEQVSVLKELAQRYEDLAKLLTVEGDNNVNPAEG